MRTPEELWARYSKGLRAIFYERDALARLVSEEVESARAEEREKCLKAIRDGCGGRDDEGLDCDGVLMIEQRSRRSRAGGGDGS